ncbi:MAG: hypothetical protein CMH98_01170 [Oceanospirillaceae bacterium]|nr:hypothetical protein [Oceanospirillaceae bacterium]
MSISESKYEAWLNRSNSERVVLVELYYSGGIEYIANRPYISKPGDSLPNQPFNDVLQSVSDVTTRIDGQLELGDIELVDDGSLSDWVDRKWRGHAVILRLGDASWSYDDFRIIARQINGGLSSYRRGQIVFDIYDQTALLDKPIQRPVLSATDDRPQPLILGQVIGALATQISTQSLLYKFSWLPVTSLVVRDGNGPEMSHTPDLVNGQFTLGAYTPRNVICDVTEPHATAISIINWVADHYGITVASGISLPSYTIGLRYDGEVSGRQILDDVCRSIGAKWQINLVGELAVQLLTVPDQAQPADVQIYADDIELDGIELTQTDEPLKSLAVNYARNYSPLSEVAGSINDADPVLADRLRKEWEVVKSEQSLAAYPLAIDQTIETNLVNKVDAEAERDRRLQIRGQRRDTWSLTAFITSTKAIVGASVEVHHPYVAGRIGRIISTRMSPISDRIEMEVWY